MPQFNCTACGADLYSAAAVADLVDPRCPTCGSGSDQVRGLKSSPSRRTAHGGTQPVAVTITHNAGHQRIVDRFAAFMAHARPDEVARLDGGGFSSAAEHEPSFEARKAASLRLRSPAPALAATTNSTPP